MAARGARKAARKSQAPNSSARSTVRERPGRTGLCARTSKGFFGESRPRSLHSPMKRLSRNQPLYAPLLQVHRSPCGTPRTPSAPLRFRQLSGVQEECSWASMPCCPWHYSPELRKSVRGGESCSTGAPVSESSCHCLPGYWGWKRRPFYVFFTPQRFDTAKTRIRH